MKSEPNAIAAPDPAKLSNREKILDAAEIEFAAHGYEGCSLRMIANLSGVNLGLIHYYFGGKEALFSAVFMRRSTLLVEHRTVLLENARARHPDEPVPVEEIVRCFITPTLEMIAQGEGPKAFFRVHSHLRSERRGFGRDLRRRAFNACNLDFISALGESCPHLSPETVVWRFTAMVGAYLFIISQSGRVEDLSAGRCDPDDVDSAVAAMIPFIVAGFMAPERKPAEACSETIS